MRTVLLTTAMGWSYATAGGAGGCAFEHVGTEAGGAFVKRLSTSCTQQERERLAVPAADLLTALKEGKAVDLAGIVLTGDLMLDQVPARALSGSDIHSARILETLQSQHVSEVRMIRGPLRLRDTQVRGRIATNSKDTFVIVEGPVEVTGSTFEGLVDLSHTAFLGSVDFSDSIFLREAFFVRDIFGQAARFERTAFGLHTRFHRALFTAPVSFLRAGFNGLAEFLEVSFENETSFARTYFKLGTGFSGSRFDRGADFSEATFEREAYFLFAEFGGDAYFRRASFRGTSDFSETEFKGIDDFSKAYFEVSPAFKGTKRSHRQLGGLQNPKILLAILAALLVFTLAFVLLLRKM